MKINLINTIVNNISRVNYLNNNIITLQIGISVYHSIVHWSTKERGFFFLSILNYPKV